MVGTEKSSLRSKQRSLTLKEKKEIRDKFLCSKVLPKFSDGSTGFIQTGLSNDALIKIKTIFRTVNVFTAGEKLTPVVIGQSKKPGGLMLPKHSLWKKTCGKIPLSLTSSDFFVDNAFFFS